MTKRRYLSLVSAALLCAHAQAQLFDPATRGETVERQ
jgi:hypothetical protein